MKHNDVIVHDRGHHVKFSFGADEGKALNFYRLAQEGLSGRMDGKSVILESYTGDNSECFFEEPEKTYIDLDEIRKLFGKE